MNRGDTTIDLKGTDLGAGAVGEAKVEARTAVTSIEAKLKGLRPPSQVGTEFLSYVHVGGVSRGPGRQSGRDAAGQGRPGQLKATTPLQTFSLFVTAEPYPAVRQPSEMLVVENDVRKGTKGKLFIVENYPLMRRSQYQKLANPLALSPDLKQAPLEMYQARNAVDIARTRGAAKYAPEIFSKAEGGLEHGREGLGRKAKTSEVISLARTATQASEDARALTAERLEANASPANVRRPQPRRRRRQKRKRPRKLRRQSESGRGSCGGQRACGPGGTAAGRARRVAEAQLKAEAAARRGRGRARQAASRHGCGAEAREAAAAAREASARAEAERARVAAETLRAQLLEQFNRILETRDSVAWPGDHDGRRAVRHREVRSAPAHP